MTQMRPWVTSSGIVTTAQLQVLLFIHQLLFWMLEMSRIRQKYG